MKVFVDVDTQCDFMNNDGALYVPGAEEIKPLLKKITKIAKDEKIPVLKTMDWHEANDKEFSQFPPHCVKETDGAASIRETSNKKAIIFEKQTFDVFDKKLGNKNFKKWLEENKVNEVWLYGVCSEICVKATVLGLLKMGINVFVFENAIKSLTEEGAINAKEEMKKAGAFFAIASL